MKRTLVLVAVVVGFAAAANAATLSVISNKTTYNVGDAITLTVSGDSQGATAYGAYGRLLLAGSGSTTPNTQTQKVLVSGWTTGALVAAPNNFSEAFNQGGTTAGAYTGSKNPFSTVTLIAAAAGVVNVSWEVNEATGNALRFFGVASPAGTSFTIVPEPATVALIGLGLMGLALGGRRRSS